MVVRRRVLTLGTGVLVVVLAAGCGSAASSSPPVTLPQGGISSPMPADTATDTPTQVATPTDTPSQSADVSGSTELATWMAAVCTASEKTMLSDTFATLDPQQVAKDPAAAAQRLVDLYTQMGSRLRGFADQLAQIGAPDVPNGREFTEGYIDAARAMADQYDQMTAGIPKNATLPQVLAAMGKADSGKMKQLQQRFESLSQLLDTDQIEAAAKSVPECKKLDLD